MGGLANLSREHLALPCPIWKITRGSLHGLIKDSLQWSMVAIAATAGVSKSSHSRKQRLPSQTVALVQRRGLYGTANTGLLVSRRAAHSSTPQPTAEMMQTRVAIK